MLNKWGEPRDSKIKRGPNPSDIRAVILLVTPRTDMIVPVRLVLMWNGKFTESGFWFWIGKIKNQM